MAYELHSSPFVARRERGFTLVELMAVVVIVGVLSMLAVLGYRKIVTSSHVTEATSMVNSIRVAQEAYHAETQMYAPCMGVSDLTVAKWYPATSTYSTIVPWGGACGTCQSGYDISQILPVHVDGPLLFGYQTVAGPAAATGTSIANNCGTTVTSGTADYFAIAAEADLDGNSADTTDVCAASWTNQLFVAHEGL
jgi:prepilin-type N-terminal cleavage/methylation domain-containing protein